MSEEKKYKHYTAADIEKYHKGLLSSKEMNELEKAALDDPFLADALEGYEATAATISSDVSELERRLKERIFDKKVISIAPSRTSFKWWKVAAAVIILGGLGYFIFQVSTGDYKKEVAKIEKKQEPKVAVGDSNKTKATLADSAINLNSTASPDTRIATTKIQKEKATTKETAKTEEKKIDVEFESTLPAVADKKQDDSMVVDGLSDVKAPAARKNMAAAAIENPGEKYSLESEARSNYFHGRIKDANNNPLPFANITNTRDNVGTYSDAQGRFTLVSPDSVLNVQVRSVGFENATAQLKKNVASTDVVLQESKSVPKTVLGFQKPDTNRSRVANIKIEELEPADGWRNYNTYLANNITVPDDLKRKEDVTGQVQVSFEVNDYGEPINIRIERSLCTKCDEEAVRAVKQGPKWKKKNKKAKRITISVPFDTEQ